ncbi:MAG: hypothetical protein AB1467_02720 [Candidatus Diapherotrites archaeon]
MNYSINYSKLFGFNVKWNAKTISLILFLALIPNLLGLLNYRTPYGFTFHFFQVAVFLAAALYGPKGGAISGAIGSMYSAAIMANPYIVLGNLLLGLFAGIFFRLFNSLLLAGITAFILQAPYIYFSDTVLAGMPHSIVIAILWGLLASDIIWAFTAGRIYLKAKNLVH